jgi:hypothetical protein
MQLPKECVKKMCIPRHKVFGSIAEYGKSTMVYFFCLKLHFIINNKGELLNFAITPCNTNEREPLKDQKSIEQTKRKLYADKDYVSKIVYRSPLY